MEERIKQAYLNGRSLTQIAKDFKVSRHRISHELKQEGIEVKKRKYPLNEQAFESIATEEAAYWLGLLFADGYIDSYGRHSVELTLKDKELVEGFARFLGSDAPIAPKAGSWRVCIGSKKLVEDIISHGCYRKKSLTLEFPTSIPNALIHHFMRGYFDGDGSINTSRSGIFRVMGTESFLNEYVARLGVKPTKLLVDKRRPEGALTFQKSGRQELSKIYDFLYKDATLFLARKKSRFAELKPLS